MSLSCMASLLNEDSIPAVLETLLTRAKHDSPSVRKKSIMVMKKILEIDMNYLTQLNQTLRDSLIDADPSVMGMLLVCSPREVFLVPL